MFKISLDGVEQPPHPGEILREDILPALHLTPAGLAKSLAINEVELAEVLSENRPVNWDLAQRLAQAIGQTPLYWLAVQRQFDMFRAASTAPAL